MVYSYINEDDDCLLAGFLWSVFYNKVMISYKELSHNLNVNDHNG